MSAPRVQPADDAAATATVPAADGTDTPEMAAKQPAPAKGGLMAKRAVEKKATTLMKAAAPNKPRATLGHFPGPQYDVRPLTTIEDVFAAVQSGQAAYGVVPFENSSNGSVVFTLDLFADLHGRYPDILVWDEIYLAKIPKKKKMAKDQTPSFPIFPLNNHQVYPAK
ncbi:hypothetical protein KC315_g18946 [Hortaea werneckii]|nr:hypothetical protein KC315_g18946 [Hortaea werneckii]